MYTEQRFFIGPKVFVHIYQNNFIHNFIYSALDHVIKIVDIHTVEKHIPVKLLILNKSIKIYSVTYALSFLITNLLILLETLYFSLFKQYSIHLPINL